MANCREAENLTDQLDRLVADESLIDHEVFLITDNSSFEGGHYKGHSPTRQLSEIVFRVHKAERDEGFILHIIHISGKRMKVSGVGGLSRRDLTEEMMSGQDPLSFIPFHLGADEQSNGQASAWVQSLWHTKNGADFGGLPLREVTKDNMFKLRDFKAARLWMLPLAAMEVALELLCEDRLAHPQWPHVFVVSWLMTHVDLLFTVPAQVPFWTARQLEPLIVAIVLLLAHVLSNVGPWLVRGTHKGERAEQALQRGFKDKDNTHDTGELHELGRDMCEVWEDLVSGSRIVLQQFFAWARHFPPVQECLVRGVLSGSKQRPLPKTGRQQRGAKCHRSGD